MKYVIILHIRLPLGEEVMSVIWFRHDCTIAPNWGLDLI